jgi:hypothetical protein
VRYDIDYIYNIGRRQSVKLVGCFDDGVVPLCTIGKRIIQGVPLSTKPGSSLIILLLMTILHNN